VTFFLGNEEYYCYLKFFFKAAYFFEVPAYLSRAKFFTKLKEYRKS